MPGEWNLTEKYSLGPLLTEQAERYGSKICTYFGDDAVTYEEMAARSLSFANQMGQLGLRRGGAVSMLMENCADIAYTWFGAAHLGAIQAAINTAYKGDFLIHQLNKAQAQIVIVDERLASRVVEVAQECPHLRHLVVRRTGEDLGDIVVPGGRVAVHSVDELLAGPAQTPPREFGSPSWQDPVAIIYTGGTTGPSKAPLFSQHYMAQAARAFGAAWDQQESDVIYTPLPLFHFNAQAVTILASILNGGTGVVDRKFSVSRTWERVRHFKADCLSILGSMFVMLMNRPAEPEDDQVPIRATVCAPVPPELHRPFEKRFGCQIVLMYGVSEAAPLTIGGVKDTLIPGSSGRINPAFDVRIFDDEDAELPAGEVGEIVCRPLERHVMFDGYYGDPEATLAQVRNLWYHTGDLGRIDEEGNFFFVDRKKDAMRRRGENISSFEVERAVMKHPAVAECAAHAVPSEVSEDDVKICVVLNEGAGLTHEEMMDHCVRNIPFFAVPRYIEIMDDLPRSPVGRILKYELRERGAGHGTWDREAAGYVVQRD